MNQLLLAINYLPDLLAHQVRRFAERFVEHYPKYVPLLESLIDMPVSRQLAKTWACSHYVAQLCYQQPELLQSLLTSGDLHRCYQHQTFKKKLTKALEVIESVDSFDKALRQFRHREMLRIIWRDLNRIVHLQETTTDMSHLADAVIEHALAFHHSRLSQEFGAPMATVDGRACEQQLLVLGMGKLGAYELNLSSDVDLIFAYPLSGQTVGGPSAIDNQTFFTRLGQRLIQSLDKVTIDGFVFRVDMRLRPHGNSGPLVLNFRALEDYYQNQGRDWERYAMVKARVITGDAQQSKTLMQSLRAFTYRTSIDESVFASLRSMKALIHKEVIRRRLQQDIKLGPGGIREVEFIVQSFQLLHGGQQTELQCRGLLEAINLLVGKHYLSREEGKTLSQAYIFLRNTEHSIQAFADRQTQILPKEAVAKLALITAMGFVDEPDFERELDRHRNTVNHYFHQLIAEPVVYRSPHPVDESWQTLWNGLLDIADCVRILTNAGYNDALSTYQKLAEWRDKLANKKTQTTAKKRLTVLMPLLLASAAKTDNSSLALLRILPILDTILQSVSYLSLLIEDAQALQQLIVLCEASPWIAALLARHPALLDELVDAFTLYVAPDKSALSDELIQQMLRLSPNDLEANQEVLCYFKLSHLLHIAAGESAHRLPLMRASDYLSFIAEVILEQSLELAWHQLVIKYGRPCRRDGQPYAQPSDSGFIIVAYGKLGGFELGYHSDLDLVFIHDVDVHGSTDGGTLIDNNVFFTRLGQQIISLLTTQTALGKLYDVDMRLRPSGASGLLVSSLTAFATYQNNHAWTWEHQALVRARVVAGDLSLAKRFDHVRQKALALPKDLSKLKAEVANMRVKMRSHLLPKGLAKARPPLFDLKQGEGGIVDIEFMAQYAVLAWSDQYPSLAMFTDNVSIFESLGHEGLVSQTQAGQLIDAYKAYRAEEHRLSLQQQEAQVPLSLFAQEQAAVRALWQQLLGEGNSDPVDSNGHA